MTTPAADDVEQAFEAALCGRPAPSGDGGLVAFTEAVRGSATAPGRPSAALAELLATGLLADQSSPSAPRARTSRRRRIRMLAPALFSKLAAAGLAAKAATVTGVAVVGVSTAGMIGALPTPAQHAFATVVDHATPFTAPDKAAAPSPTTDGTDGTKDSDGDTTATTAGTEGTDGTAAGGDEQSSTGEVSGDGDSGTEDPATPTTTFGQQVSQMAHDNKANGHPGVDGQAVSSMARARHSDHATDSTEDEQGDDTAKDATDDSGDDASKNEDSGDDATQADDGEGSASQDSRGGDSSGRGSHHGSGRGSDH